MRVNLLTEYHLEFLSLKEGCTGLSELHLSKYYIVGNHMSLLNYGISNKISYAGSKNVINNLRKAKPYHVVRAAFGKFLAWSIISVTN